MGPDESASKPRVATGEGAGDGLKLLVLGPLGPPHVEDQVLALAERGFDIEVGGNALDGLEDEAIAAAGIPVHASPAWRRSTPWGMAATTLWARRLIKRVEPDVVQAHWLPGFGFAAAAAGARNLAATAWGSDVYQSGRVMTAASRYAIARSGLVLADSRDLADRCIALGAAPERTKLIQWGVDLKLFGPAAGDERERIKAELGLGPGPVILSPRSLMPVYNIPTILEAFDRVGASHPEAQLVIKHMGAGSVQIDLPALPHPDRVKLVGGVPYERMADYYRAADIVVSVTSSDGSPRSVWEAMASGAACVLTDLPWVRDLLEPGRDVVTVPVCDAEALAAELDGLIQDPDRRRELAAAGRDLVRRELNREDHMDALAAHLASLAR